MIGTLEIFTFTLCENLHLNAKKRSPAGELRLKEALAKSVS